MKIQPQKVCTDNTEFIADNDVNQGLVNDTSAAYSEVAKH